MTISTKGKKTRYQVCVVVKFSTTQNICGNILWHHSRDNDLQLPIWKGIWSHGKSSVKYLTMEAYGRSGGKLDIRWRCVVSCVPRYWDPCTYGYPISKHSQLSFAAPQLISLPNYFQYTFHYVTVIPDDGLIDNEIKHRDNFPFTYVLTNYRRNYTGTTFLLLVCQQITEQQLVCY
jgi:hypothetical protein